MLIFLTVSRTSAATVRSERSRRGAWPANGPRRPAESCARVSQATPAHCSRSPIRTGGAKRGRARARSLENGRGAALDSANALAREPHLAVAELAGSANGGARILLAAKLDEAELERQFADRIEETVEVAFETKRRWPCGHAACASSAR